MRISLDGGRLDIWEALCYYVSPSGNWKVTKSQVKCEKTYFSTFQYRVHLRLTKWWKHLAYYIVPVTFLSFFFNIPLFINLKVKQGNSFDTKLKSKVLYLHRDHGWKMWRISKSICTWGCSILWLPLVLLQFWFFWFSMWESLGESCSCK